jgi:hypothetical protein
LLARLGRGGYEPGETLEPFRERADHTLYADKDGRKARVRQEVHAAR